MRVRYVAWWPPSYFLPYCSPCARRVAAKDSDPQEQLGLLVLQVPPEYRGLLVRQATLVCLESRGLLVRQALRAPPAKVARMGNQAQTERLVPRARPEWPDRLGQRAHQALQGVSATDRG